MTLLLAFILTAVILYQGAEKPAYEDQPVVVGSVLAGSPAEQSGIQPGDRVVAVADKSVNTWEDFYIAVGTRANREVEIRFVRDGAELTRGVTPGAAKES